MKLLKKLFVLLFLLVAVQGWCVGSSTQTLAEVSNYPKFLVGSNVSQVKAAGVCASFSAVTYDTHAGWDGVSTYTVRVEGWYVYTVRLGYLDFYNAESHLIKNGVIQPCGNINGGTASYHAGATSAPIYCLVGDAISVIATDGAITLSGVPIDTFLSGYRIP